MRRWESLICATSFGVIGIWCMHFIGNRAIILGGGGVDIQLVYSPGYTVLSVFLPIIGLTIAFSVAEMTIKSTTIRWCLLVITGIFAGMSIVAMHYVGNFGVSNYKLQYAAEFLAASMIIAVGDCLIVLLLFYKLRERWISHWWSRILCAMVLAGGVSAMHFTASTHCVYTLKDTHSIAALRSRNLQVIIAAALCGAAALVTLAVLLFRERTDRINRTRSQKVVLACAMFDPDGKWLGSERDPLDLAANTCTCSTGRVLVTTDGLFPSREITDKYLARTFDDDFDTSHPIFQWLYRVSRNWEGITSLIPKMKSHLSAQSEVNDVDASRPTSAGSSATYDPESYGDYTLLFRERFCTAAGSLAASMHLPVERVGVLYDKIIDTGTLKPEDRMKRQTLPTTWSTDKNDEDIELAFPTALFGRGQLLFLARQLDGDDASTLLNAGYRFANMSQVSRNIADTMQIPQQTLDAHIYGLRHYIHNLSNLQKTGTWLSCFAIVPKPNSKGFDIAVKSQDRDQLPDIQLLPNEPLQWQAAFLDRMHDKSSQACYAFLEDRHGRETDRTPQEKGFANVLMKAMLMLNSQVPAQWFQQARFYGRPVFAHYTQPLQNDSPPTIMYAFTVCGDLHTSIEASHGISRAPLSFFSTRQQCFTGSPNNQLLVQRVHQEFSPLFSRKQPGAETRPKGLGFRMPSGLRTPGRGARTPRKDDWSDTHELVDPPRTLSESSGDATLVAERSNAFGGILVNSETVVQSDFKGNCATSSTRDLGLGMEVGFESRVERSKPMETFVDELFAFTRSSVPSWAG